MIKENRDNSDKNDSELLREFKEIDRRWAKLQEKYDDDFEDSFLIGDDEDEQ